jgi:hypothetical protein
MSIISADHIIPRYSDHVTIQGLPTVVETVIIKEIQVPSPETSLGISSNLNVLGSVTINGLTTDTSSALIINTDKPVTMVPGTTLGDTGGNFYYRNSGWYMGVGSATDGEGIDGIANLTLWRQLSAGTPVTNTTAMGLSILGAGVPRTNPVLPANSIHAGSLLNIKGNALLYSLGTSTGVLGVRLGGSDVSFDLLPMTMTAIDSTLPAVATYDIFMSFSDTTHCVVSGNFIVNSQSPISYSIYSGLNTSPADSISVNMAIDNSLEIWFAWSEASASDWIKGLNCVMTWLS